MNHLAHLLLADGSPESILGNFLGDFAKGRPEGRYPPAIVRGIRLHRRLDAFTDAHPAVQRAVARLPTVRRRFAWVAVDMAFDHFLARDWQCRAADEFAAFRRHVYAVLRARSDLMPPRARQMLPAFTTDDWLRTYAHWDGLAGALAGMGRRLSRPNALARTATDLAAVHTAIEEDFHAFWPDVHDRAVRENRRLGRGCATP